MEMCDGVCYSAYVCLRARRSHRAAIVLECFLCVSVRVQNNVKKRKTQTGHRPAALPLQLNNAEAARRFLQIITKERKSRKMLLPAPEPVQLRFTPSLWRAAAAVMSAQTLVAVSSFMKELFSAYFLKPAAKTSVPLANLPAHLREDAVNAYILL